MSSSENDRLAQELGLAWDRLVAGKPAEGTGADPALVSTILLVEQIDRVSPMSSELRDAIWANVIAGTGELWRPDVRTAHAPARRAVLDQFTPLLRWAGIVLAGMIGGFIAGIGSRIFMRLAGFLTIDQNRFHLTENDARVGEITLDGTMSLGALGAGAGVVTLLIYLALRDRLPFQGWRRASAYGVLLLLVFGFVIMNPSNPDYQLFGPTWLNVSTFSSLYLLMGFCCVQAYELGRRFGPSLNLSDRSPFVRVAVVLISLPLSLFGLFVLLGSLFIGAPALLIVVLAGIAWLVDRYLVQGRISFTWMPVAVRQWGVLVVPGIVGFVLTARGITEILLNR